MLVRASTDANNHRRMRGIRRIACWEANPGEDTANALEHLIENGWSKNGVTSDDQLRICRDTPNTHSISLAYQPGKTGGRRKESRQES